ncbi:MAG: hypothetical protein MJ187_04140 [Alphaproteobacteria bacterium]|nr:hypothetical protein [Alphaproteobacteria bacterium]
MKTVSKILTSGIISIIIFIIVYCIFLHYAFNFNDYYHIKSIVINNKTYSLYEQIRNCKDDKCMAVAECLGGLDETPCPVNVPLMDNAIILLQEKQILDIYKQGEKLIVVLPKLNPDDKSQILDSEIIIEYK